MMTNTANRISVVIPAHNEEENLAHLVPGLKQALGSSLFEVIAVNAESTDNTAQVGKSLERKYPFFRMIESKSGVGNSLRAGYRAAKGDWILSIDGDFLRNMEHFMLLVEKSGEGYDMVTGSRYIPGGKLIGYPPFKKFANRLFHGIVCSTLNIPSKDLTNNFKLMKKEVAQSIPSVEPHFAANAETGIYPSMLGYRVGEVPVPWIQRDFGGSKFSTIKLSGSYARVFLRALWLKATGKIRRKR
jgi:glycosyltransferase involved in cell wall biosynthesis